MAEPTPEPRLPVAYTVCTPDCEGSNPNAYDAPFDRALAELGALGYDGVELQLRDPATLDPAELMRRVGDAGLEVAALATGAARSLDGLDLSSTDEASRVAAVERMARVVDLAAELAVIVTVGSVRGAPAADDRAGRAAVRASLDELAEHAARSDVRVALEPQHRHVGPYLTTIAQTRAVIDQAGWSHVGIVADTFHMAIEERSLPGGFLRAGDRLWHVQLGENHRGPLGSGSLALTTVLDTLHASGYRGWLTMEHAQRPDSRTAAQRSLAAVALAAAGPAP